MDPQVRDFDLTLKLEKIEPELVNDIDYNSFSGRSLAIITNLLRVNITSPGVNFIISPVFLPTFENEG